MGIAGGLAHLVGDDALVDAAMGVADRANHQAVDVPDCRREQHKGTWGSAESLAEA